MPKHQPEEVSREFYTDGKFDRDKYANWYMREWRKKNPEENLARRIRAAKNLLEKNGYTVTKEA